MWFRFSFILHVMVPQPYGFPLCFSKIGMVNQKPRVLFQMGEDNAAIHSVGGLLIVGGGSLMTHNAGSL